MEVLVFAGGDRLVTDPRVRNAVLVSMLGEEGVRDLVRAQKIPAPPMALATAPAFDPGLDRVISAEVAADFVAKVAGKRVAGSAARRIPLVGGLVGLLIFGCNRLLAV